MAAELSCPCVCRLSIKKKKLEKKRKLPERLIEILNKSWCVAGYSSVEHNCLFDIMNHKL